MAVIYKVQIHGLLTAIKMKWVKKVDDNIFELQSEMGNNSQRVLKFYRTRNCFVIVYIFSNILKKVHKIV